MSHKRTQKDVERAYYRGFRDGFHVRPNPLALLIRTLWKKHEQKKMKKAFLKKVKENRPPQVIGYVTSVDETPEGLTVRGKLNG